MVLRCAPAHAPIVRSISGGSRPAHLEFCQMRLPANPPNIWMISWRCGTILSVSAITSAPSGTLNYLAYGGAVAHHIDRSQQRKLDKIAAATSAQNTFSAIAAEYLDNLKEGGAAESTRRTAGSLKTRLALSPQDRSLKSNRPNSSPSSKDREERTERDRPPARHRRHVRHADVFRAAEGRGRQSERAVRKVRSRYEQKALAAQI
jgi:hypothetical protein